MSVTAVLLSGGLDSAVLAAEEAARGEIQPIYVRVGLAWEDAEHAILTRLLATDPLRARVRPLVSLHVDMRDVYATTHWAVQGTPPAYHTPDEDVYLPGRNVVLLGKAGVFCAAARIDRIVLGTLGHNPFPDATPAFRSAMAEALSLGSRIRCHRAPYADVSGRKWFAAARLGVPSTDAVVHGPECPEGFDSGFGIRGSGFIAQSRSTINQSRSLHCGLCSRAARHDAFLETGRITGVRRCALRVRNRVALSLVVGLLTAVISAQTAQTPDPLETC
jgi:7-cyano-7-deazaguanine synthase in queuosine biosynthesis